MTSTRHATALIALIALVAVGLTAGPVRADEGLEVVRLAGETRVETAVAVAQDRYPDRADAVVLARADVFADALAGAPFAVHVDGPILLTPPDTLHPAAAAEISRLLEPGATVHLLGGNAAISDAVAGQVTELGMDVNRVAGLTRADTAAAIFDELPAATAIAIVDGADDAIALLGSAAMARTGGAVLLTVDGTFPQATLDRLRAGETLTDDDPPRYFLGEPVARALATGVEVSIRPEDHLNINGVVDISRFLAELLPGAGTTVGLASMSGLPDALAAGPHAAAAAAPLLLTDGPTGTATQVARTAIETADPDTVVVYGGTGVLDDDTVAAATAPRTTTGPVDDEPVADELRPVTDDPLTLTTTTATLPGCDDGVLSGDASRIIQFGPCTSSSFAATGVNGPVVIRDADDFSIVSQFVLPGDDYIVSRDISPDATTAILREYQLPPSEWPEGTRAGDHLRELVFDLQTGDSFDIHERLGADRRHVFDSGIIGRQAGWTLAFADGGDILWDPRTGQRYDLGIEIDEGSLAVPARDVPVLISRTGTATDLRTGTTVQYRSAEFVSDRRLAVSADGTRALHHRDGAFRLYDTTSDSQIPIAVVPDLPRSIFAFLVLSVSDDLTRFVVFQEGIDNGFGVIDMTTGTFHPIQASEGIAPIDPRRSTLVLKEHAWANGADTALVNMTGGGIAVATLADGTSRS
jgi:putative cell wall-binding protein